MVNTHHYDNHVQIELLANRSATWREAKILIAVIATFVFTIALAWTWVGVWIILPFAGAEVGLLALLMYQVNLNCYQKQIITISRQSIGFECGIKKPVFRWQFPRNATHISVLEPETQFDRPRMVLTDNNISIQLGEFLNQQDCQLARESFKRAGLLEVSDQWWKS
jgi:uncharacterized membrane protein